MANEKLWNLAQAFVLGPYMAFSARGERHPYFKAGLMAIGIGTTLYNLYRLTRVEPPALELSADEQLLEQQTTLGRCRCRRRLQQHRRRR